MYSGQTTSFAIDARDVGCKKIDVEVLDPSGQPVTSEITQESGQPISVSYTPSRSGPHKVNIIVVCVIRLKYFSNLRLKSMWMENKHSTLMLILVSIQQLVKVRLVYFILRLYFIKFRLKNWLH